MFTALEAAAPRPMYQEQLAIKVHVQSQTLGRVLARLEEGGLVTRTRNPADRRQFQVQITEAGNAALQAARQAESAAVPADFDGWESLSEQLARFVDFFQKPQQRPPGSGAAPQDQAFTKSMADSSPVDHPVPPASPSI